MRPVLLPLIAACLVTAAISAQNSLVISPDVTFVLKNNKVPAALGNIDDQESVIVTPNTSGAYEATPFRTFTGINVMHGDGDLNSNLNDTDVYGDCNCLFVKNMSGFAETGPFNPGSLWMSCTFNTAAAVATTAGVVSVRDADIFRARQGKLEIFVSELDLAGAMGNSSAGDFDIDGMVQDQQGNLLFTLWNNNNGGGVGPFARFPTITDGDVYYIAATDITYDSQGNISAINFDSAQLFADETDMTQLVVATNSNGQNGTPISSVGDTCALNLDPSGGLWVSPKNAALLFPNIIFGSNFIPSFGTLWSTANGGSLAVINGVTMGHTTGSADGTRWGVGQLPSGQDGLNALAIIPEQHEWIAIDSPLAGGSSQGQFTMELGRFQPATPVGLLFSFWAGDMPGGWVPGLAHGLPFIFGNEFLEVVSFADLTFVSDSDGYLTVRLPDPGTIPIGLELLVQAVGFHHGGGGKLSLSATSNLTF